MTKLETRPFDRAVQSARTWINAVAATFDTEDREFAFRVTRAWLHALRDELPVPEAAHFAAQLPDLLRGVYYENWNPAAVPTRRSLDEVVHRFAADANVSEREVPKVAWLVSDAIATHVSGFEKTLDRIRHDVRALFKPSS
jgi:uncharacterized protein (DUF2267 family)